MLDRERADNAAGKRRLRQENKPPVQSRVLILFTVKIFPAQRHSCTAVTLANLIYLVTGWGGRGAPMKSSIAKGSVVIGGHKTSVSLEDLFWTDLKAIAGAQQMTLSGLVSKIDGRREQGNLSSMIRLFVLHHHRNEDKRMDVAKDRLSTVVLKNTSALRTRAGLAALISGNLQRFLDTSDQVVLIERLG